MEIIFFDNLIDLYTQNGIYKLREAFFNDFRGEELLFRDDNETIEVGTPCAVTGDLRTTVYYFKDYLKDTTILKCDKIREDSTTQMICCTSSLDIENMETYISNSLKSIILPHADIFTAYPSVINPIIELIHFFNTAHHISAPNYFNQILPKNVAEKVMPDYNDKFMLENLSPLLVGVLRAKKEKFPFETISALYKLAKKLNIITDTDSKTFTEVLLLNETDSQIKFACSSEEIGLFLHCIKTLYIQSKFSVLSYRFVSNKGTTLTQQSFNTYQSRARQKLTTKNKLFITWEKEFSQLIKSM